MQLAVEHEARDALIENYRHYVRNVAIKMVRYMGLPMRHLDDFISAGYLGLVEAAERYDANTGSDFKRYAFLRIRGSIIDSIRRSSHVSGKAYKFAKALKSASLLQEELNYLSTQPSSESKRQAKERLAQLLEFTSQSFLTFKLSMCDVRKEIANIADYAPNQEQNLIVKEENNFFYDLVETLPEKERLIIKAHYFEGKSFQQILGEYEGFSKSWISRLHTRAIKRLKLGYMQKQEEEAL